MGISKEGKGLHGQLFGSWNVCGDALTSLSPPRSSCLILPVSLSFYMAVSRGSSKAMESEMNAFGTSCYRIMLNIKRIDRVSNAKIYDLIQTALLVENVRTRQLRFLGHVLRMPDDEPCKEYALYIPPHGKRKPGRQRTLFLRYIQHLLGDTDNMIGPGKLSQLAQDRCGWRKLVVACPAADR